MFDSAASQLVLPSVVVSTARPDVSLHVEADMTSTDQLRGGPGGTAGDHVTPPSTVLSTRLASLLACRLKPIAPALPSKIGTDDHYPTPPVGGRLYAAGQRTHLASRPDPPTALDPGAARLGSKSVFSLGGIAGALMATEVGSEHTTVQYASDSGDRETVAKVMVQFGRRYYIVQLHVGGPRGLRSRRITSHPKGKLESDRDGCARLSAR
jgi:hypothetical protein